jgi:hypothetical protein
MNVSLVYQMHSGFMPILSKIVCQQLNTYQLYIYFKKYLTLTYLPFWNSNGCFGFGDYDEWFSS